MGHARCRVSAIGKAVWTPLTIEITLVLRWIIFLLSKASNCYAFWRAGIVFGGPLLLLLFCFDLGLNIYLARLPFYLQILERA